MYQVIDERLIEEDPIAGLTEEAVSLLKQLIEIPSFSENEDGTANLIITFLANRGIGCKRHHNNVWAYNKFYKADKPTILLNSHHDTVQPNVGYTRDPFDAEIINDKFYGLGSNDAGGSLVSLLAVFCFFYNRTDLAYNLCFLASAEEESSGKNGISSILHELGKIDFAIVGEPTKMDMATAEMGCMVLDCTAYGVAGHSARNEGVNALYKALSDIQWFSTYNFPKQSGFMGPIKMTVTGINAGLQHNIIPNECQFMVDVRLSDCFTVEEILVMISQHTTSEIKVRPGILKPTCIDHIHPVVRTGLSIGRKTFVSPTSSDRGWLDVPSIKMGPGDSARSHMADEFIFIEEISEGILIYIRLLKSMMYCLINNPDNQNRT
ncbi:M20/M25/M40 family metallo-hydrolase [Mucilaginibacter sp. RB4R14]|uniref:M20/M25/M40 family metallo-hydrolase n=1 Tax=Mucilaginibacter aurantiaciroseus TaxID=2949308 RepID=UPI0020901748|nr:M20/M25/M40 family metallo-hydrolase [Mucilaginibacter aurantiaciroseus]MCO5937039.1 M20/M25/M40 family metallo-hydrolase [Mucilaginibacter aurantiaciroseus]